MTNTNRDAKTVTLFDAGPEEWCTFYPNKTVTTEPCPVCRCPDATVEHGHRLSGLGCHNWDCPECENDGLVTLLYDCVDCGPNTDHADTKEGSGE